MPDALRLRLPSRLCAALVAICYLWLGLVVSFQHTHSANETEEARTAQTSSVRPSSQKHSASSRVVKHTKWDASRCVACDWQALSASPALPILHWTFTPAFAPRVLTTFPRYLRVSSLPTASRGPPAV